MSHPFYNVVHIVGIVLLMVGLGGALLEPRTEPGSRAVRRITAVFHGIGIFLILLGGFGMLARLGVVHGGSFPGWVWGKLVIWLILGATIVIPRRAPRLAGAALILVPVLAGTAAYLAIYKPF
jgi:hypothetical protein